MTKRADIQLFNCDCLEAMRKIEDNSVDAVITDPPYGLSFMGKKWDYDVPSVEIWSECLRVLKPGGYLLAFAGTRTQHRMAVRIEDAGFEIRDMIAWVYGSGFPKSLNIGKAVDKLQGNEREVVGDNPNYRPVSGKVGYLEQSNFRQTDGMSISTKGTSEWEGWGTALKPALEPITVARKPLSEKTVAENCLKWGVGGLAIDGCRIYNNNLTGSDLYDKLVSSLTKEDLCQLKVSHLFVKSAGGKNLQEDMTRRIKNLCSAVVSVDTLTFEKIVGKVLEDISKLGIGCSVSMLEEIISTSLNTFISGKNIMGKNQKDMKSTISTELSLTTELKTSPSSQSPNIAPCTTKENGRFPSNFIHDGSDEVVSLFPNDSARFFYCAKASKSERNRGCEELPLGEAPASARSKPAEGRENALGNPRANNHPTVKPIALMEYIVKLVSRKGAVILDPFMGSGSTGIACKNLGRAFIGIEKDKDYYNIAIARLERHQAQGQLF